MTDQIPIEHAPGDHNRDYLRAKKDRLGHLLHHQGLALDEEMIHEEQVGDRAPRRGRGRPVRAGPSAEAPSELRRYAACVGRFYEDLADRLVEGATRVFLEAGGLASTCTRCPARSSCRWRRSTAPSRAATPAWSAWAR